MITNKFIYLKHKAVFDETIKLVPKDLNPIIFIEDSSELYTCGTFFHLGYPDVRVAEKNGVVTVNIGQDSFNLSTNGDSLSIRKGTDNNVILTSYALTKLTTDNQLRWDDISKTLFHNKSGVEPGSYGQSVSVSNASIIEIPNIVINEHGHVVSAKSTNVQIRDYVGQLAPGIDDVERNVIQSYNQQNQLTDTDSTRKTNGLTFNDKHQRLSIKGGISSSGPITVLKGDVTVVDGYIVGKVKGDVEGSATPKIHLSKLPDYGGASKALYGHVVLNDNLPLQAPEPSSDNININNLGVSAKAASPLMVWNSLSESKRYTNEKAHDISIVNDNGESIDLKKKITFSNDFNSDENNILSLKWIEIL